MDLIFQMETISGKLITNLDSGDFDFSFVKNGKRVQALLPKPIKVKKR